MTPVPLKSTGAEFLWGAIMLFGEYGKISQAIEKLFLVSDLNVKIRQLDSASGNRRFIAHELSQLSIHTLMIIFWCTIHINHAITTSAIQNFGMHSYNGLYSASLLMRVGANFFDLIAKVPLFVKEVIYFTPSACLI